MNVYTVKEIGGGPDRIIYSENYEILAKDHEANKSKIVVETLFYNGSIEACVPVYRVPMQNIKSVTATAIPVSCTITNRTRNGSATIKNGEVLSIEGASGGNIQNLTGGFVACVAVGGGNLGVAFVTFPVVETSSKMFYGEVMIPTFPVGKTYIYGRLFHNDTPLLDSSNYKLWTAA